MLDQLHEASHWQNVYVPPDGKGRVGCDTRNILRCQECFPNLRTQDTALADEARRLGSHRILHRDARFVARARSQLQRGMGVHR
ncbi:hypothetical protein AAG906_024585 [Vitis piasezkii]